MIKKSIHEDELIQNMQHELRAHDKKQGMNNLVKAAEYLHSAIGIFEEAGMNTKADQIFKVLLKIANDEQDAKKHNVDDKHTKGLTPEKMVANLKQHGIVFNMADDGHAEDRSDKKDKSLEVFDKEDPDDQPFEDND